jgi:transposase
MKRHAISDKVWATIEPLIPKGGGSNDNRLFIDAVVYVAKTGIPWRDLPPYFGKWNSVFARFNRWGRKGLWKRIFDATADTDPLAIAIDSTSIRANQVASGLKKTPVARAV